MTPDEQFYSMILLAAVAGCALGPTAARMILHALEQLAFHVDRRRNNRKEYGA